MFTCGPSPAVTRQVCLTATRSPASMKSLIGSTASAFQASRAPLLSEALRRALRQPSSACYHGVDMTDQLVRGSVLYGPPATEFVALAGVRARRHLHEAPISLAAPVSAGRKEAEMTRRVLVGLVMGAALVPLLGLVAPAAGAAGFTPSPGSPFASGGISSFGIAV